MADTFSEFLRATIDRHGFGDTDGKRRFLDMLKTRYLVEATPMALSHWLNDHRTPAPATLIAILDALDVHGVERERAFRLAAGAPLLADASDVPAPSDADAKVAS